MRDCCVKGWKNLKQFFRIFSKSTCDLHHLFRKSPDSIFEVLVLMVVKMTVSNLDKDFVVHLLDPAIYLSL